MLDLPRALYDTLVQDSTLVALLSEYRSAPAVFASSAPEEAVLPYVVCAGAISAVPVDSKTRDGREVVWQVTAWARRTGSTVEVDTIAERVRELLHHSELSISGFQVVTARISGGPILNDEDDAYGRVLQVRCLLSEA